MNINKEIDFSNEMRPSASPPLTYPKARIKMQHLDYFVVFLTMHSIS